MICIYCLKDKKQLNFKNREHVIPQCFGRFSPDNLVLRDLVCDECNQYFGDNLELYLGRDSFESILRLRHGLKPKASLKKPRRLTSKMVEGEFKNAIVKVVAGDKIGSLVMEKIAQAGFYNKERDEYDFYEIENIPTGNELLERGYEVKGRTVLLIGYENEIDLLKKELHEKDIPLKGDPELIKMFDRDEKVTVMISATSDRVLMRAICKITFNYLAYIVGKEFVLKPIFDGIRNFIRNDIGPSEEYISYNLPPILYDDQILKRLGIKVTIGHIINLEWNGINIVSKISLFNAHTYGVTLCKNYDGIWIPLRCGHHFDIETKQLSNLIVASKRLLP